MGDDTLRVNVLVRGIERLRDCGALLALADVVLDLDGVEVILHGVRVERTLRGQLRVAAPTFRHRGQSLPALSLPEELRGAIADLVLEHYRVPPAQW